MPTLPAKMFRPTPAHATALLRFWKSVQSLSVGEILTEAERPFTLALVGTPEGTRLLAERLSRDSALPDPAHPAVNITQFVQAFPDAANVPEGALLLTADTDDEAELASRLARLVMDNPDLRLSLARHVPAFRPASVNQMINDTAFSNAKLAAASALPGLLPFTALLLPGAAMGDMVLLTRNQAVLLLRIAAAYGLEPDLKARTRELLPVVGGAFGWRAVARELLGLVPGGIGIAVKAAVAYAGTYTVGKAAFVFYSTGQTLSGPRLRKLYADSLRDAQAKVRGFLGTTRFGRKAVPIPPSAQVKSPLSNLSPVGTGERQE